MRLKAFKDGLTIGAGFTASIMFLSYYAFLKDTDGVVIGGLILGVMSVICYMVYNKYASEDEAAAELERRVGGRR